MLTAPLVLMLEMLLLLKVTLGEKLASPKVPPVGTLDVPAAVSAEIVLFETLMLVGLVPTDTSIPCAPPDEVALVEVMPFTTLPVTLALSVPEASTMPTGCSALASEILPTLLLEMVTPLIP